MLTILLAIASVLPTGTTSINTNTASIQPLPGSSIRIESRLVVGSGVMRPSRHSHSIALSSSSSVMEMKGEKLGGEEENTEHSHSKGTDDVEDTQLVIYLISIVWSYTCVRRDHTHSFLAMSMSLAMTPKLVVVTDSPMAPAPCFFFPPIFDIHS
jgi:hypothetical protein